MLFSVLFCCSGHLLTDSGGPGLHPGRTVPARKSTSFLLFRHLYASLAISMGESSPFTRALRAFFTFFSFSQSSVSFHCVSK